MPQPRKPAAVMSIQTSKAKRLLARVPELDIAPGPVGDAPEWFDADALEAWLTITEHPQYSKVLTPLQRPSLVQYCALWSLRIKVLRGDEGAKMSTMDVQVLNSLTQQFGFTPASQAKVVLPNREKSSNFAKFAGGGA